MHEQFHHGPPDLPSAGNRRSGRGRWAGKAGNDQVDERGGGRERGRARNRGWSEVGGGFGRHGGFGGPGMGGPRRGRKAGRGDVRAAIIALLAEAPMHGYQIITEITDRSGGVWQPSPGSVYPTLQALEDQGLVTVATADGRRVFSLTDEGRAAADAMGDGPSPWAVAARRADRSMYDLGGLMREVAAAIGQVGRTGSTEQVRAVKDILTDTRRRIYLLLADGPGATDEPGSEDSAGGELNMTPRPSPPPGEDRVRDSEVSPLRSRSPGRGR